MDSDHYTAAAGHFQDDSFEVRKGEDRYGDAILWLSFRPSEGTMNMAVYDGAAKAYSHQLSSTDAGAVAGFIAAVEADYGVKVPRRFKKLSVDFLTLVGDSFGVDEDVYLEAHDCELCGSDYGKIEAFYFPPLTPGGAASLGVVDTYGCFGGESVFGDPADPDVADAAMEILDWAVKNGDDRSAVDAVKAFRTQLKAVLAESAPVSA